jgi:hypothetical protein
MIIIPTLHADHNMKWSGSAVNMVRIVQVLLSV